MSESAKKILIIEDDRETAGLIAEELGERGYDVSVAYDGREGFAAILKAMPDLVLSDISMPVMTGFEVLERLTALARGGDCEAGLIAIGSRRTKGAPSPP